MANMDIEAIVVAWLGTFAGEDYPVSGDIPEQRPESFITVDRTGGPRESMVLDRAEILIEVYHKTSRVEARNKAAAIGDALPQLLDNHNVTRAVVNSTVNLPDLIGEYQRYQVYCDIYYRR